MIDLLLFAADLELVADAEASGVAAVIVDLEVRGKERRQEGFDTEIAANDLSDVVAVRAATSLPLICRVNAVGPWTPEEVEVVIGCGVDEILVPMVRVPGELASVLDLAAGRCGVAGMVETQAAVECVDQLAVLPLSRMYLGLNDLKIDRGSPHIFSALADGTVERVRGSAGAVPFGFAGLTLPECGAPLECRHLVNEMARLDCQFTFLRRSFFRDIRSRDPRSEVPRIVRAVEQARLRAPDDVERDRLAARAAILALPEGPWQFDSRTVPPS